MGKVTCTNGADTSSSTISEYRLVYVRVEGFAS